MMVRHACAYTLATSATCTSKSLCPVGVLHAWERPRNGRNLRSACSITLLPTPRAPIAGPDSLPCLFVGNKADPGLDEGRAVRHHDYARAAAQLGVPLDMFKETCARQNRNCSNVFFAMARGMLHQREAEQKLLKELKRQAAGKNHKRSLSTPSTVRLSFQLPSPTQSCADIVFDSSALVPGQLAGHMGAAPPAPPPPPLPQQQQQQQLGRGKNLTRTTTSLRRQREQALVRTTSTGPTLQRRGTVTSLASSSGSSSNNSMHLTGSTESASVSSCSARSNSTDDSAYSDEAAVAPDAQSITAPLRRANNSCSNLAALQRTATLRRQVSTGLHSGSSGSLGHGGVRRSSSSKSLSEMVSDRHSMGDVPASFLVQLELERALLGVVSADDIPQAKVFDTPGSSGSMRKLARSTSSKMSRKSLNSVNNMPSDGHSVSTPQALPASISPGASETYGLRRSMELRAARERSHSADSSRARRLSREGSLPGGAGDMADSATSALSVSSDSDSAVGSMGSVSRGSTQSSSPEPEPGPSSCSTPAAGVGPKDAHAAITTPPPQVAANPASSWLGGKIRLGFKSLFSNGKRGSPTQSAAS